MQKEKYKNTALNVGQYSSEHFYHIFSIYVFFCIPKKIKKIYIKKNPKTIKIPLTNRKKASLLNNNIL